MSDDLIKRLGKSVWTLDQAEDRIKELEKSNKELTLQLLATSGQAADALDKLAKAVEVLRWYADFGNHLAGIRAYAPIDLDKGGKAEEVLAELEGKE